MYRESPNIDDTSLVTGTLQRVNIQDDFLFIIKKKQLSNKEKTLETLYKEEIKNGSVRIFRESANVHLALTESLKDVIQWFFDEEINLQIELWICNSR